MLSNGQSFGSSQAECTGPACPREPQYVRMQAGLQDRGGM